jgi:hypothetical protein
MSRIGNQIARHKTAIERPSYSLPISCLLRDGFKRISRHRVVHQLADPEIRGFQPVRFPVEAVFRVFGRSRERCRS